MRKRLLIGATAVVMIAVAAYVLSQPRKGTVEWHKERYTRGWKKVAGDSRWDRTLQLVNRSVGTELLTRPNYAELEKQMDGDYEALLRLGFVVKKYYAFTNRTLDIDAPWITEVYGALPENRAFFSRFGVADLRSNTLFVAAPPQDVLIWEKFIGGVDVPESK